MAPRRRTVVLATAAVLLGFVTLCIASVATLTQTDSGRAMLLRALMPVAQTLLPGQLYVGRVSGSLFTDITIDSLEIREPTGGAFIRTGPIHATYDPRDLLDRRIVIKTLDITRPLITLIDYGNDDWNWKRALRRKGPKLPHRPGSLGDYIVVDTTTVHETTLLWRQPWTLPDSLTGAKRDSAVAFNLARIDGEIRRDGSRFTRIWRFVRGNIALGRTRIADPDSAGAVFGVKRMDVVWVYPPFYFNEFHGAVRWLGDSVWADTVKFRLERSRGRGDLKIVWGSNLPVRYDIRVHGDSVAMSDIAWIHPSLPTTGGGTMDLTIRNDPRNLNIIEYAIRNMDAHSMQSRIMGRMTYGVGGEQLRITDVSLNLAPAHTDLLRYFNGVPFPLDWQGRVSGTVLARGGPVRRFQLDRATLSYDDAHVEGAQSRATLTGMVDIYKPSEAVLSAVLLNIEQLDLRTPRFVNPLFPKLNGFVRGSMQLDSLWYDARFSNADIEHVDGSGQPSHATGSGRYTILKDGVRFDVDMQVSPLSYTTLSRSYPGFPVRGTAVGSIRAAGMAEDFSLQMTLAGEGGEISYSGRADGLEPIYGATGQFYLRSANLQALFGDSHIPLTRLSLAGNLAVRGADLLSLRGPLRASIDEFSRVADVRVYSGSARMSFDSGVVHIDTLAIESSALRLTARGGIGLVAGRPDTLQFSAAIDSLGGLRPWLDQMDSTARLVASTDTLRGTIELRGRVYGTIDTADARGLTLDARADGADVVFGATRTMRFGLSLGVTDVMHGGNGTLQATLDSARVAGIDISSATGRSTLRNGLAERFGMEFRTASQARLGVVGGLRRLGDTTTMQLDTLSVRVDSLQSAARGFSLAAPAVFRFINGRAGSLDSLVLVHTDTGRMALRGFIGDSGAINGRFDADRVPLADLGRLLATDALGGGTATASVSIAGSKEHPRMEGTVALRNALVAGMRFSVLDVNAHYDSLRLNASASLGVQGKQALAATASLPLDLALVPGRTRQLDQPLSGRLFSSRTDLALLESLFPDVTSARGRLSTDVELTGTWERPRFRGQLLMDSASLTLANLGVHLDKAFADISLTDDTVFIRRFGATSGTAADSLGISGKVAVVDPRKPVFDLRMTANNFLAIDKARTATVVLTTTTPISLIGSSAAPRVRGAIRIDRGRLYIRALAQRRGLDLTDNSDMLDSSTFLGVNALLPDAPNALIQNLVLDNVRVNIGDDVWLRSPEANLKLGGTLRVTRAVGRDGSRARLALADSLTVERGTYQLNLGIARPGFEVERGVVRFYGDPELEPALDITALHTVRELRANSNRQNVNIRVSIGGTIDRPTLALSSADNPPLPESDMLSYLVTGEPAYALLGTDRAEQGATLALRLAGSYLSSRLAGGRFDVVQIEPSALAPGDAANLRDSGLGILASTRVGVGGQLARNTYFSFTTGLCGLAPQSGGGDALSLFASGLGVKLERRFDRGYSVALGLEPSSSAQSCGRLGISRTFQQTPPQIGIDFFRAWTF